MRRAPLTGRIVVGLGVLLLAGGTASVWAGDGPHGKHLHLMIKVTATTPVDVDGSGDASIGDTLIEQGDLYTADGSTKVGDGYAVCTQVTADQSLYDCQGSDLLPGGEIREAGRVTDPSTFTWAVLGGTGKYVGVGGSVTGTSIDATTIDYTISLTRSR
jgi:hypothetical protein